MIAVERIARVSQYGISRAHNQFGRYKREEYYPVRTPDTKKNEVVAQLKEAWRNFHFKHNSMSVIEYRKALNSIKGTNYPAKDVEMFSLILSEFQDEKDFDRKAGLFLSALVNTGSSSSYIIHTYHLEIKPEELCFENIKNVIINGDVGDCCGNNMQTGKLVIQGNAGQFLGEFMTGGAIVCNGDADGGLAQTMEGGTIIINGNTGPTIGQGMKGGEVHIEGDYNSGNYESLMIRIAGKVFHKGRLLYGKE